MKLIFSGTFVADENGSNDPLRRYTDKTLVIVLPGDLTVFDIGNINLISTSHRSRCDVGVIKKHGDLGFRLYTGGIPITSSTRKARSFQNAHGYTLVKDKRINENVDLYTSGTEKKVRSKPEVY